MSMAAIAAGVSIAGTAVAAGSAIAGASAQGAAAKASAAAGLKGTRQAQKNLENDLGNIPQVENRYINPDEATGIARKFTRFNTRERERIMPGSAQQFQLGSNVLQSYLRGEVPQDVVDFTQRQAAERFGGTYNPASAGAGQFQGGFGRNLGLQSIALQGIGLSASPNWQQLAQSFITSPMQTSQLLYQYDVLNSGIDQFNSDMQMRKAETLYGAAYNTTGAAAGAAAAGPMANAYMANAIGSAGMGVAQGVSGAVTGYQQNTGIQPQIIAPVRQATDPQGNYAPGVTPYGTGMMKYRPY